MKTDTISISEINLKTILFNITYYFIAGVLLFSGIVKIIEPLSLIETMRSLNLLPENLIVLSSTLLPIIEIVIGGMLLLKINEKQALVAATLLFSLFLVVSIYGYVIGLTNDCGCFGGLYQSNFGLMMILRNFILFIVSIVLLIDQTRETIERI